MQFSILNARVNYLILDITNSKGILEIFYAWSLGFASNNQVQSYGLLYGVNLVHTLCN